MASILSDFRRSTVCFTERDWVYVNGNQCFVFPVQITERERKEKRKRKRKRRDKINLIELCEKERGKRKQEK